MKHVRKTSGRRRPKLTDYDIADVATALHDPRLGLDRSVCLRDVVGALRERDAQHNGSPKCLVVAADFIEREFGAS